MHTNANLVAINQEQKKTGHNIKKSVYTIYLYYANIDIYISFYFILFLQIFYPYNFVFFAIFFCFALNVVSFLISLVIEFFIKQIFLFTRERLTYLKSKLTRTICNLTIRAIPHVFFLYMFKYFAKEELE